VAPLRPGGFKACSWCGLPCPVGIVVAARLLQCEMRGIGWPRTARTETVPGFVQSVLLCAGGGVRDRQVPARLRQPAVPLPVGKRRPGRNDELPRTDGEFLQTDLHAEQNRSSHR